MSLDELRAEIDELDSRILELLNERANCALKIGHIKQSENAAFYVPERERAVFEALYKKNAGPLPNEAIRAIYREVISAIRSLEKPITVAYLGPQYTFSHIAALRIFGATADLHPMPAVPDIFHEVERGHIDYGVVPVESSMGGGVIDTLDRFITSDLKIINEIQLRVSQNLLSISSLEHITRVYSKDQSFFQCRNWLQANVPNAEHVNTSSTSEAARIASEEEGAAAIASALAAEAYNLDVVASHIEDSPQNYTRFFVIGQQVAKPTGKDKTTILAAVKHEPGALYRILLPFADADVNMTNIGSRPSRKKAWEYVFFVDLEGHVDESPIKEALPKVAEACVELRILGSYPVGDVEE